MARPTIRSSLYSDKQLEEILSRKNRDETRYKLRKEPTTKDLIDNWESKWLSDIEKIHFQLRSVNPDDSSK